MKQIRLSLQVQRACGGGGGTVTLKPFEVKVEYITRNQRAKIYII